MFPGEPKNAKPIVHPIVPDVWPACTHTRNWQYYIYIQSCLWIIHSAIGDRHPEWLLYKYIAIRVSPAKLYRWSGTRGLHLSIFQGPSCQGTQKQWQLSQLSCDDTGSVIFGGTAAQNLGVSLTKTGDTAGICHNGWRWNQPDWKKTNLAVLDCQCIPNTWTKEQKSIKTWVGNHRNKSQPWKCQACHNPQKARGISSEFLGVSTLQPFTFATPRPPKAAPRKPRGSAKMATVTARSHGIQRRKWLPWMAITCHHQFGGWFSSVGADVLGDSNVLGHMVSNKLGSPSWYLR